MKFNKPPLTIVRTFRDKLFTEIFPGRTWVPKTLIFAEGVPTISFRERSNAA